MTTAVRGVPVDARPSTGTGGSPPQPALSLARPRKALATHLAGACGNKREDDLALRDDTRVCLSNSTRGADRLIQTQELKVVVRGTLAGPPQRPPPEWRCYSGEATHCGTRRLPQHGRRGPTRGPIDSWASRLQLAVARFAQSHTKAPFKASCRGAPPRLERSRAQQEPGLERGRQAVDMGALSWTFACSNVPSTSCR